MSSVVVFWFCVVGVTYMPNVAASLVSLASLCSIMFVVLRLSLAFLAFAWL